MKVVSLFKKYSAEFALVFLDAKLPDCYGWYLVPIFRSEDGSVLIIAISATLPNELKGKSEELKLDFDSSKPFDTNYLYSNYRILHT